MEQKKYEVKSTFIRLKDFMNGMLYEPVCPDKKASTAIVLIHSDADYLNFIPGPELAGRGYRVLAANVTNPVMPMDQKLLDVKTAVEYVKELPGVTRLVLLGHSGGATLMSCYQAVAENGTGIFQDEGRIVKMSEIGALPKADAMLILDSNWGNGVMTLLSLDPAITDETSTHNLNPEYDLFNPDFGYKEEGATYSSEFIAKYQRAQAARNNRLIRKALDRLEAIERGEGLYEDDEPFIVPAGSQIAPNNKMFPQDIKLLAHTKEEWPLLHADGTVTTQVVPSLRKPKFDHSFTKSYNMSAMNSTVRTYLANSAIFAEEDFGYDDTHIYGINWDSSYSSTPGNVQHIHVPMLIMGMTGGYECLAAEVVYEKSGSVDKTLAFVEGASHNFTVEPSVEEYPGQYGSTETVLFDYVDEWLQSHR